MTCSGCLWRSEDETHGQQPKLGSRLVASYDAAAMAHNLVLASKHGWVMIVHIIGKQIALCAGGSLFWSNLHDCTYLPKYTYVAMYLCTTCVPIYLYTYVQSPIRQT